MVSTSLYGKETLTWYGYYKSGVKTIGMDILRLAYDIIGINYGRNNVIQNLCCVEKACMGKERKVCLSGYAKVD